MCGQTTKRVHVVFEQSKNAPDVHFLAFSDGVQNGVYETWMNCRMIEAALGENICRMIGIGDGVVGDRRRSRTKGLLHELMMKLSKGCVYPKRARGKILLAGA